MKKFYFLLFLLIPAYSWGQYTATFTTANKGYLYDGANVCANVDITTCSGHDVSGETWTISSAPHAGTGKAVNSFTFNGANDGFYASGGNLRSWDSDGWVCWESPSLSMSGTARTISVTWTGSSLDPGEGTLVSWIVDGTQAFQEQLDVDGGTYNITTASGNTLQFQVCANSSTTSEEINFTNISSSAVLPIELLSFNAEVKNNQQVLVKWQTATEVNNDYMAIERSRNGQHFNEIGRVNGRGNSSDINAYQFVDTRPEPGQNYYRLRQVDYNGAVSYHKVDMVTIGNQIDVSLFPNPVNNFLQLNFSKKLESWATLNVYNFNQQLVHQERLAPYNTSLKTDLSHLPGGMYIIDFQSEDVIETIRFMKE